MTKKQQEILRKHLLSNRYTLSDAYKKPSKDKIEAYNDCRKTFEEKNGYKFKIIARNMYVFSIGYFYNVDLKTYFHYETDRTILEFEVK